MVLVEENKSGLEGLVEIKTCPLCRRDLFSVFHGCNGSIRIAGIGRKKQTLGDINDKFAFECRIIREVMEDRQWCTTDTSKLDGLLSGE